MTKLQYEEAPAQLKMEIKKISKKGGRLQRCTNFDNSSDNVVRFHLRVRQFRRTSRTRGDASKRERSKSKNKENQCSHSYKVIENM